MDDEVNLENSRYHPQHPLPEEIREMGRDNTVCQFCGVSYLIHNEIKTLQQKLDEYKNEVERLKHYDEREKILNGQVNTLNNKSKELLEKWQVEEKRNNEYGDFILQKNLCISQLKKNIENCTQDLDSTEASNEHLKKQIKQITSIALKINISQKDLREELSRSYNLYQNDLCQFMDYWNKQKDAALEGVAQFVNMRNQSEEKNKQFKHDMDCQSSKYERKIQDAEMKYENQRNILDKCSKSINEFSRRIALCIVQLSEFEKKYLRQSEKCCERVVELNKKVYKVKTYLKSVKDRKSFIDSVEKYKHDNIQLKDERARMVNAHQHQIKQLHDSFMEKLLEAEVWPGKLDEKMKELQCIFDDEKRQLLQEYTESLNKAAAESETKCKLLNDSKEKCKREIKKLDEKLKLQQRNFNEEKTQLLKQVTESYEAATDTEARYNQLNEEKANHLKTIRKLEQHLEMMQVKFHGEMLKQVEQHEKEKKITVASFEHKISELSKHLQEKQHLKSNISNEGKESVTRTIKDLQSALSNAKEIIIEKLSIIEEYKNEICSLRDCVRRECEERFELTEALAEARTELLSQQRFSNKNNSSKQFASHPLVYNQNSSPTNKLSEISKSHGKLVKLEELPKSSANLDESKISLGSLPISPGSMTGSRKSQNPGKSSSISRYPKNKLKISLKNNLS